MFNKGVKGGMKSLKTLFLEAYSGSLRGLKVSKKIVDWESIQISCQFT